MLVAVGSRRTSALGELELFGVLVQEDKGIGLVCLFEVAGVLVGFVHLDLLEKSFEGLFLVDLQ